jgi:hypothetical protein
VAKPYSEGQFFIIFFNPDFFQAGANAWAHLPQLSTGKSQPRIAGFNGAKSLLAGRA